MIIEEFMLCANETVAQHMYWLEAPFIYRVHEEPDLEDIFKLNEFLNSLGYHVKVSDQIHPSAYQNVVAKVDGRPEERVVKTVLLRSMKHARYAAECLGHFRLSAMYYLSFYRSTSDVTDLIVHRVLRNIWRRYN